jgi:hypothetical protein
MNPRITAVQSMPDHQLLLQFSNGETGTYNCKHLLKFGIFSELQDENYFSKARAEHGTVVWPNDQDICPDTLYLDSVKS